MSISSNIRSSISNIERQLNSASKIAAEKNITAALVLGEVNTKQFIDVKTLLKGLASYDVLVGIPDATTDRKRGEVTNAELAYLHTHGVSKQSARQEIEENVSKGMNYRESRKLVHQLYILRNGSPAWRIPPRPIIEPAIEDSSDVIAEKLQQALGSFLKADIISGERKLKITGMKAQNIVRAWFVNPKNNWPPNSPATIMMKTKGKGGETKPLIDTGELRKSITYVVRIPDNRMIKRLKKTKTKLRGDK